MYEVHEQLNKLLGFHIVASTTYCLYGINLCYTAVRRNTSLAMWTLARSSRGYSRLPKQLLPRANTDDERERCSTPWKGAGGGGSPLNAAK